MKWTLSKTRAYEWYEDLPHSGRPSTSAIEVNIAKVKEIVTENPNSILREKVALSVSHESIRTILTNNLCMKHVARRSNGK
jgi:hypothetical protein